MKTLRPIILLTFTGQRVTPQSAWPTLAASLLSAPPSHPPLCEFLKGEQHLGMFPPSAESQFPTDHNILLCLNHPCAVCGGKGQHTGEK